MTTIWIFYVIIARLHPWCCWYLYVVPVYVKYFLHFSLNSPSFKPRQVKTMSIWIRPTAKKEEAAAVAAIRWTQPTTPRLTITRSRRHATSYPRKCSTILTTTTSQTWGRTRTQTTRTTPGKSQQPGLKVWHTVKKWFVTLQGVFWGFKILLQWRPSALPLNLTLVIKHILDSLRLFREQVQTGNIPSGLLPGQGPWLRVYRARCDGGAQRHILWT